MASVVSHETLHFELPAPSRALMVSVALVMLIAVADFLVGSELTFSILYFVPLFMTVWRCGLQPALALAAFAVIAWLTSDILSGHQYTHAFYRWWEAAIKLGGWVMFVALLDRLRHALDRSDERFAAALDGLDAVAYVADLATGRVLYANPSARILLDGRDGAASFDARWHPDPATAFARERLVDGRGEPHGGVTAEFDDLARRRRYLVHARAIRWSEGQLARLLVASDVTERSRAESGMHPCEATSTNASHLMRLGEMAATLAHELNQPVAAIANYNRGALRRLRSGACEAGELVDALEKSAEQAERAGCIIQRVRDLVCKRAAHRAACDVEAIIARVAKLLQADAAQSHVKLTVDVAPALPPVHADAVLIEQALMNLCRNAIECMQRSPHERRVLAVAAHPVAGERVRIEIADTGCGVSPVVAEQRNELFYTTREDGTGLGLHICRSVLEAHQTRLDIACRATGGSVFSFTLPHAAS